MRLVLPLLLLAFQIVSPWKFNKGNIDLFTSTSLGRPEGLIVHPETGNVFVSFLFQEDGRVVEYNPEGEVVRTFVASSSSGSVRGLIWAPDGKLIACDANGTLYSFDVSDNANTAATTLATLEESATSRLLNGIAFGKTQETATTMYVTESSGGSIYTGDYTTLSSTPGTLTLLIQDDLLNAPPFGANGIDTDTDGALYITVTGTNTLLKYLNGELSVLSATAWGADGLYVGGSASDRSTLLFATCGSTHDIRAFRPDGTLFGVVGSYAGFRQSGEAIKFDGPATTWMSAGKAYVTNPAFSRNPAIYTVSVMPAQVTGVRTGDGHKPCTWVSGSGFTNARCNN